MSTLRDGQVVERFATFECGDDECIGIVASDEDAASRTDIGVVIVVGGPQYRVGSHRQFVTLARALAASGMTALRFDYRGMGDSAGESRNFECVDTDIDAAITALQRETGATRIVLWGLCDGASAALMHAAADSRVAGIVLVNPWARSEQIAAATRVRHYYLQRAMSADFWRKALRGGLGVRSSLRELAGAVRGALRRRSEAGSVDYLQRMHDGLARFRGPVLCVLSGNDFTAREFEAWADQQPQRKALLARPGVEIYRSDAADHTFSDAPSRDAVTTKTIEWITRLRHAR